jgi:hypothetical protein
MWRRRMRSRAVRYTRALEEADADDGTILDNSESVSWWADAHAGSIISPTIDYRPPGTCAIAFVLKRPAIDLPGGSVSYRVV